ncbi:hypothetical protein ACXKR8_037030 [Streptacidiphilus sp. PAMC 29251]
MTTAARAAMTARPRVVVPPVAVVASTVTIVARAAMTALPPVAVVASTAMTAARVGTTVPRPVAVSVGMTGLLVVVGSTAMTVARAAMTALDRWWVPSLRWWRWVQP